MGILDQVPGLVAGVAGPLLFKDATITRSSGRSISAEGLTVSTTQSVACKALVTDYSSYQRAMTGIPSDERKVLVLGDGLANDPAPGDIITVDGGSWIVVETSQDPARATFDCRSKPHGA